MLSTAGHGWFTPASEEKARKCLGRRCNTVSSVVLKSCFQLGEVQRRTWLRTSSCRQWGTPDSNGDAWGLEAKKNEVDCCVIMFHFECQGDRCHAVSVLLNTPHRNTRTRNSLMSVGSRADPLFTV